MIMQYYSTFCTVVFLFLQVFLPKFSMHLSSLSKISHALPIFFSLTWSLQWLGEKHKSWSSIYVIFSIFMLLYHFLAQIFSTTFYCWTTSAWFFSLIWETIFYSHEIKNFSNFKMQREPETSLQWEKHLVLNFKSNLKILFFKGWAYWWEV